ISQSIRIIDLLTHTSGLPAYAPVSTLMQEKGDPKEILKDYISHCERNNPPRSTMNYSCLNYISLQYIIEQVSGMSLHEFTQKNIYQPLELTHTTFVPNQALKKECAPTEVQTDGTVLQGEVHDPLARIMNAGISGNAGLFSTAEEVAVLSSLFLNNGSVNGKTILSPASIQKMLHLPLGLEEFGRTPAWDLSSPYASQNGDLFGPQTVGHTGYTGTSISIDPETNTALIILTNSVHPYDKGRVIRLRALLANIVASSIGTVDIDNYLNHYAERIQEFESEKPIGKKDIVFLGNSLTENGGDWAKRLGIKHVRNRGIIGDNTEGVWKRLESITKGTPKQILITIGINDISQGLNLYTLLENTERIIQKIQQDSPQTLISIQSLLPINEDKLWYRLMKGKSKIIEEYNVLLQNLASRYQLAFINSYPIFLEEGSNQLKAHLTGDGLHINDEGYQLWSQFLKPYLID
ncbi:MAG: serine hydrolase, partial [Bacteroides sp.]